jgi:hypothetical protein
MDLSLFLDKNQINDLQFLAKQKEWSSLYRLLDNIQKEAYKELGSFKDEKDAFLKKGKLLGIMKIHDAVKSLYDQTRLDSNGPRELRESRESADESESEPRRSFVY